MFKESGARGCISKSCTAEEMKQAIRIVYGGGEYFSFMARKEPIRDLPPPDKPAVDLTRRELEVIRRVASGLTSEEIAAELGISIRTVEFHKANIKEKTGARYSIGHARFKNKILAGNARPTVPNPNWPPERIGKTAVPLTAKDWLIAQFFVAGFTREQVAARLRMQIRSVKRHQMNVLNVFQFRPGTRNIMHLVLAGYTNGEIAALLGISSRQVEFRRGQLLDIGRN